jgi:hypothetical protein
MTEQFNNTVIVEPTLQPRGNLQVYDATYSPIRLVFGVINNTATVTFSDPATNATYITATGGTKTLRVLPGATLDCDGSATFASAATSAFSSSIKQGTATVSTTTGGVVVNLPGGASFKRFTYAITFPQAFASPPQVYLTLASNTPTIKTHACSNITATGFDAHVDDYDDPTSNVVVQWLAIL